MSKPVPSLGGMQLGSLVTQQLHRILNSPSHQQQQQHVLALLKSNPQLMASFIKESAATQQQMLINEGNVVPSPPQSEWNPLQQHLFAKRGQQEPYNQLPCPQPPVCHHPSHMQISTNQSGFQGHQSSDDCILCYEKPVGHGRACVEKVAENMGNLFVSGDKSDITVQVKEAEFKAHSLILCARSPVLSAMLEHDTAERASRRITIDDCEPDVFGEYLRYIYTGSVQFLNQQTVFGLYRLADKYLADDLKRLCSEHIQDTLSVQTFCDTVKLALMHEEDALLKRAVEFARCNFPSIVVTREWQDFNCEYPMEVNEILVKCFCRQG